MKNILLAGNVSALAPLASPASVLVFDYDGTLSPIAARHDRTKMRQRTVKLLAEATRHFPCVAISGRLRRDVMRLTRGIRFCQVIGNHGLEWQQTPKSEHAAARTQVALWLRLLLPTVARLPGVEIENKRISLSVHYRRCPAAARVAPSLAQALQALPHARIIGGKKVFNVLPADAMDKGQALLRLMRAEKYRHALFIGDDETDEYAFRAAPRPSIITVRVGADRNSAADWYVRGQRDVDELLARIIRLKIEASRNPGLHRR